MTSFALAKGIELDKKDSGTMREGPIPAASRTVGCLRSMQNQMQVSSKDWTSQLLASFPGCSTVYPIAGTQLPKYLKVSLCSQVT